MKKLKIILIMLVCLTGFVSVNNVKAQPGVGASVDFNTFYNDLSPYGRWVDDGQYGRVWVYNEPGFRPYYTNGHWDYTDYGWTWMSDYEWGWGPFHYGRWQEDPELGWIWIPGYDWAPAWVAWSEDPDYYGWAPLGYGLGLDVSIGSLPYESWCFLPRAYITNPYFYNYAIPFERNRLILRNSVMINNIYSAGGERRYFMGPERGEVERYTHQRIEARNYTAGRFGEGRRGGNAGFGRENGNSYNRIMENRGNNGMYQQNRAENNQRAYGNAQDAERMRSYRQSTPNQQQNAGRFEQRSYQQPQAAPQQQQQRNYNPGNYNQQRVQRSYNSGFQGGGQRQFSGGQRYSGSSQPGAPRNFGGGGNAPSRQSSGGGDRGGRGGRR